MRQSWDRGVGVGVASTQGLHSFAGRTLATSPLAGTVLRIKTCSPSKLEPHLIPTPSRFKNERGGGYNDIWCMEKYGNRRRFKAVRGLRIHCF